MRSQSKHVHGDALMQALCQVFIQQGLAFQAQPLLVGGWDVIIQSDIPFNDLFRLAQSRADSAIQAGGGK